MKHKKYLRKQVEGEDGEARDSEEVIFFRNRNIQIQEGLHFSQNINAVGGIVQSFDKNMSPTSKMTFRMCFLRATTTTTRVRELLISRRRTI